MLKEVLDTKMDKRKTTKKVITMRMKNLMFRKKKNPLSRETKFQLPEIINNLQLPIQESPQEMYKRNH